MVNRVSDRLRIRVSQERKPRPLSKAINELVRASTADIMVLLADDVTVHREFETALRAAFWTALPDLDGVVAINAVNHDIVQDPASEFAFVAIGRAYADRFPDRAVRCPDYWHFHADTEMGEHAQEIGLYYRAEDCQVTHHHPRVSDDPIDETHKASRSQRREDDETRAYRGECGYLWGRDFHRVRLQFGAGERRAEAYAGMDGILGKLKRKFGDDGPHWSCLGFDGETKLRSLLEDHLGLEAHPEGECPEVAILEIGTHYGVSASILAEYGRVWTYDIEDFPMRAKVLAFLGQSGRVTANVLSKTGPEADKWFLKHLPKIPARLAFVDGDHSYEAAAANFQAVKHTGAVIFHDYKPGNRAHDPNVVRLVHELEAEDDGSVVIKLPHFALWMAQERLIEMEPDALEEAAE
jgi:hypothetical protein